MELSVDRVDSGVVIVSISGEVDWNTSPKLHSTLVPLYAEKPSALVVDLSGVSYIDSSGIATLTEGLQWSLRSDIPLRLSGMTPEVKDVFKMAKLEELFEILDTRDAALKGLT